MSGLDAAIDGAMWGFFFAVVVGLPIEVLSYWLTGWGLS